MLPRSLVSMLLLVLAPAVHASPTPLQTAGLVTNSYWAFDGVAPHDGLGFSVAGAGDINADGYSDILVSAHASTAGNTAVYLFFGSASGPVVPPAWKKENYSLEVRVAAAGDVNGDGYDDVIFGEGQIPAASSGGWMEVRYGGASGLSATPDFSVSYPGTSGGYTVGTAGDVNGDGFDDVFVGDPTYGGQAGQTCTHPSTGRLAVYYGSAGGLSAGSAWLRCGYPAGDNSMAGESFAGVGDVNADGYDDLVTSWRISTGEKRLMQFFGAPGGLPLPFPNGIFSPNLPNSPDLGHLLAPAGDVNGDGYGDVVIGDPHYGAAASDTGVVFVVPGGPNGMVATVDANGTIIPIWTQVGSQPGSQFGASGFTAGDINGDGLADIALGAAGLSSPEPLEGMFVPYLSTRTTMASFQPAIEGNVSGMGLGSSICAAGDVNGDGFGDVLVGAPQANVGLGQVRIYYGAAEKPAALAITRFGGQQSGIAGWSVAVGDVNGDGHDDVLMGAPNGDVGLADTGLISLFLGVPGGIAPNPVWTAGGLPGSNLGVSSAMGLDINGDGFGDLIAGAHIDAGNGSLNVWYGRTNWAGSTTAPDLRVVGLQSGAQFGASVAFAGDVNGDGYADVLVGAPLHDFGQFTEAGRASLFLGGSGGLSTMAAWTTAGTQVEEHLAAVASAGDVNGDGFSDVIVGGDGFDDGAVSDAGRALVFLGGLNGLSTNPQREWKGESSSSLFGHAVAGIGDMDGDGWGDVAVGAYSFGGTGKVYVFGGSASGSQASAAWSQAGAEASGAFASTVSGAGDVDGDGRSDLLVGAVFQDGPGKFDCGKGYVYTGPFPATIYATFTGPSSFANMGHAIAAGDVNADGFGDLVFGEPRLQQTQFDEGGFELYLGNLGHGRARPAGPARAGFFGIPVCPYGTSGSTSAVGINAYTFSAGGRDRVASEWWVDPVMAGASSHSRSPFIPMAGPNDPGAGLIAISSTVGGLTANTPYAWRVRTQARSPYFRFGSWITAQGNARRQWDFRTLPGPNDVPGELPASAQASLRAWPNPSSSGVQIAFELSRRGEAVVDVRDLSGRRVRQLAHGIHALGENHWFWDGRDDSGRACAPGLYFAVLESGEGHWARRITLLR